ncbi:MAG: glycogen-binding domain-containing protein [Desulfotignum sp.]|nr:glycogen-binding domain-containing protein [Desulfotignum sp.]
MNERNPKKNRRKIVLSLHAPTAKSVFLAGDFNKWNPEKHGLKKGKAGVWEKTLMLTPSTYEYKFIVDGEWQIDPSNNRTCQNCFGTRNNLLTVPEK